MCVTMIWLNLLSLIRKMPFFGIYVVMFTDVFRTFLKVSGVVLLFIISFSLGFYALLENQPYFSLWSLSLIKTFVMSIGELEYDNMFFDNLDIVHYKWTTRAFFVAFVLVMPIIIMNLLVGLAVDDIKTVQENAILKRLAMQVTLEKQMSCEQCIWLDIISTSNAG